MIKEERQIEENESGIATKGTIFDNKASLLISSSLHRMF
jgi:hypothetical protein